MAIPITHIITDLSTGGSQKALLRLLDGIDRRRFSPSVVCLRGGDTPLANDIRSLDVTVLGLCITGPGNALGFRRLLSFLDDVRPVIVHSWLYHAVMVSRLFGRIASVPILISSRRNINLGSSFRERLNRLTLGIDDRIIAVSDAARQVEIELGGADPRRVVTIVNGVESGNTVSVDPAGKTRLRHEAGATAAETVIGTVGRLHREKGLDVFLEAAAEVLVSRPETRFVIVGSGPDRAALESLSDTLGIASNVALLGERSDVTNLLSAMDLFVLSSPEEGMPNVVLEAMAAGLPVVATGVGGTPEVVADGKTGLLVPPGDPPRLAGAITTMLADPDRMRMMGREGLRRVRECFRIETMVERTEELYEEVLSEKLGIGRQKTPPTGFAESHRRR